MSDTGPFTSRASDQHLDRSFWPQIGLHNIFQPFCSVDVHEQSRLAAHCFGIGVQRLYAGHDNPLSPWPGFTNTIIMQIFSQDQSICYTRAACLIRWRSALVNAESKPLSAIRKHDSGMAVVADLCRLKICCRIVQSTLHIDEPIHS